VSDYNSSRGTLSQEAERSSVDARLTYRDDVFGSEFFEASRDSGFGANTLKKAVAFVPNLGEPTS
jgi:hypothetical protein